jgi:hypothetical protein
MTRPRPEHGHGSNGDSLELDPRYNSLDPCQTYTGVVPLEGHWQRQHASRASDSKRERRVMHVIAGLLCACAIAAAIAVLTSASGSRPSGCIDVPFASTTGAAVMHACGDEAARLCRSKVPIAREPANLRRHCHHAGLD